MVGGGGSNSKAARGIYCVAVLLPSFTCVSEPVGMLLAHLHMAAWLIWLRHSSRRDTMDANRPVAGLLSAGLAASVPKEARRRREADSCTSRWVLPGTAENACKQRCTAKDVAISHPLCVSAGSMPCSTYTV